MKPVLRDMLNIFSNWLGYVTPNKAEGYNACDT